MLQGPGHHQPEFGGIHRLGQVIISPLAHGGHGVGDGAVTGDDDAGALGLVLRQIFENFHAPQAGHGQVGQRQVKGLLLQLLEAAFAIRRGHDGVTFGLKDFLQALQDARIIVNHQDIGLILFHRISPMIKIITPKVLFCQYNDSQQTLIWIRAAKRG